MTSSELSQRWAAHQAAAAASAAGGGISGDWRIIPKRKSNVLASMLDYHHHQAGQHNNHRVGLFQVNTNKNKTGNRLRLLRNPSAILSTVPHLMSGGDPDPMQSMDSMAASSGLKNSGGRGSASGSRSVSLASVSSDGSVGSISSETGQAGPSGGPTSSGMIPGGSGAGRGNPGVGGCLMVEQEDIVALTQEVRAFKEALGRLRRLFGGAPTDLNHVREKCEGLRVSAHERLGEVLRILRIILERYPALQSTELLVAAGSLIHQVKEHPYEDEKSDVREFMESIDQLALAFSSRVSEYLMGDLDSNISLASSVSSKTKSCENLPSDVENGTGDQHNTGRESSRHRSSASDVLNSSGNGIMDGSSFGGSQMDAILLGLEQGVEVALHRAKLWSKYAKDIMTYVEKRCNLEAEFAKSVAKLAQTMKSALKEECYLPFQSIYITAMEREIDSSNSVQSTTSLLTGHKFLEPLSARRNEHERCRKQIKETWHRELKRMQEAVSNLRKAKSAYVQRQQEWERAKEAALKAEAAAAESAAAAAASAISGSSSSGSNNERSGMVAASLSSLSSLSSSTLLMTSGSDQSAAKVDKRKRTEEDALQKAMEAEAAYKASVGEANERHGQLLRVKAQVLQQVRELMLQCDQTMKAVTVSYFQLQHTLSAPSPVQFQTLCESSRLYEPGSQYVEFIRKMPLPPTAGGSGHNKDQQPINQQQTAPSSQASAHPGPYAFEPYSEESTVLDKDGRKSNGSLSADSVEGKAQGPMKAWSASAAVAGPSAGAHQVVTQVSSDNESVESSPSAKSRETSPTASPMMPARRIVPASSGDELENEPDPEVDGSYMGYSATRRHCMSKAAVTHTFRKLKTPSRCRECDSYVYFQGAECVECGLGCHKKCLESLTIQCGHKRLPRKMTTFGVDLSQHLSETGTQVPHLLAKCIAEIDQRGIQVKGLYRVSGVKSKVEKLCQSFENGADLVDLTDTHPNVIANVLKLYLRQLPEALITSRLYPDFIRVAREWVPGEGPSTSTSPSMTVRIEELKELVQRLPRHHYATLAFLMHHLKRVANESESNNMPASNLGIVFGPTLLRTSEGSASLSSLVDTVHQTRVIELLIDHAEAIFGPAESLPTSSATGSKDNPAHRGTTEGSTSLLSKVPVVRSISFLEKHRSKSREIPDPPSHLRHPAEEVLLPGFVADSTRTPNTSLDLDPLSEEGLLGFGSASGGGSTSDNEDLPDFLLPDDSSSIGRTPRKLPGYLRTAKAAPKIFKSSLKDYHGLEGVDLNLLSTQDHEVHPVTPSRSKKSVAEPVAVVVPPVQIHQEPDTHSSLTVQTSGPVVKTGSLTPFMDSSIDSDHSWESHSTGSSGRGTQHSDQGSLGSAQRALLLSSAQTQDETDAGPSVVVPHLVQHRLSHDENRVKIQVPSAATWSTHAAPILPIESRGVVTVLEGPQSGTTLVESLSSESKTTTGGSRTGGGGSSTTAAALTVSDLAAVPVGLTHEFAHVFGRSSSTTAPPLVKSLSTTSSSSTMDVAATNSGAPDGGKKASGSGERSPRFV